MKKTALWIIIMLFIVCLIGSACGGETSFDTEQLEAKTTTIVQHLLDGDYEAASSYFAPELTQQLPVESLQAGWEQMVGPSGNYYRARIFRAATLKATVALLRHCCALPTMAF